MRKIIGFPLIVLSIVVFIAQSCENETIPIENLETSTKQYEYFENEVSQELIVSDASNENTVFIKVFSDKIATIENFLTSYEFKLIVELDSDEEEIFINRSQLNFPAEKDLSKYSMEKEPEIFIEITTANLKPGVSNFFIDINTTKKSALYTPGYPVGYSTYDGFLGTVHKGWGSEFIIQWTYKYKWYSSLEYYEENGVNAWFIYPASLYYGYLEEDWYKINLIIRPDIYQTSINYRIAYSEDDMYGQTCSIIGSYDGSNCYIGSAPAGTNAFFYTYGSGNTYCMYTPVNGNQCPLSGSVYDGANCRFLQIPSGAEKFLYNNGWYVKPDLINL